jgi:hypothetical protein
MDGRLPESVQISGGGNPRGWIVTGRLSRTRSGSEAPAEDSGVDEAEPDFELPEELHEYTGDPTDRKALLIFRQAQQAARQVPCITSVVFCTAVSRELLSSSACGAASPHCLPSLI